MKNLLCFLSMLLFFSAEVHAVSDDDDEGSARRWTSRSTSNSKETFKKRPNVSYKYSDETASSTSSSTESLEDSSSDESDEYSLECILGMCSGPAEGNAAVRMWELYDLAKEGRLPQSQQVCIGQGMADVEKQWGKPDIDISNVAIYNKQGVILDVSDGGNITGISLLMDKESNRDLEGSTYTQLCAVLGYPTVVQNLDSRRIVAYKVNGIYLKFYLKRIKKCAEYSIETYSISTQWEDSRVTLPLILPR